VWREEAAAFGEVSYDVLGSSWVRVPGTSEGPLLAIVGHIDEIALVVTHAGDDGLIAVRQLGGFDAHVLLGQRLDVLTREGPIPAVVGARKQKRKRGEDRKPLEFDDLYLDIGAKNGDEVRSVVRVGDAADNRTVRDAVAMNVREGSVIGRRGDCDGWSRIVEGNDSGDGRRCVSRFVTDPTR
jgi:endoglucanase